MPSEIWVFIVDLEISGPYEYMVDGADDYVQWEGYGYGDSYHAQGGSGFGDGNFGTWDGDGILSFYSSSRSPIFVMLLSRGIYYAF